MAALRAIQIEEAQLSWGAAEAVYGAIQRTDSAVLDAENAAAEAAILMPDVHPEPAGSNFERVLAWPQRNYLLAELKHGRTAAGCEESFDLRREFLGTRLGRLARNLMIEF
jgi:hypothetical protein